MVRAGWGHRALPECQPLETGPSIFASKLRPVLSVLAESASAGAPAPAEVSRAVNDDFGEDGSSVMTNSTRSSAVGQALGTAPGAESLAPGD